MHDADNSNDFDALDYERLGASIVHDFNNLLTPIASVMSELQRAGIGDHRQRAKIDGALLCTLRARALAYQLLDLSKFCRVEEEIVDLAALLSPMEGIYASILGSKIQVRLDVAVGLPLVKLDPSLMERALLNLVLNARNAMHDGGHLDISASLVETTDPQNAMVRVTVADTGSCMDVPLASDAVSHPPKRPRGNGLGLAMVKRFVDGVGGRVTVAQGFESGTAVNLWIPPVKHVGEMD